MAPWALLRLDPMTRNHPAFSPTCAAVLLGALTRFVPLRLSDHSPAARLAIPGPMRFRPRPASLVTRLHRQRLEPIECDLPADALRLLLQRAQVTDSIVEQSREVAPREAQRAQRNTSRGAIYRGACDAPDHAEGLLARVGGLRRHHGAEGEAVPLPRVDMWSVDDEHRSGDLQRPRPGVPPFSAGCIRRRRQERE